MKVRFVSRVICLFLSSSLVLFMTAEESMAQFQWADGGILTAATASDQVHLSAVPDGKGGFFMTYEDDASGDADIHAQWVDGSGVLRWGSSGVTVTTAAGDQRYPAIAIDGSGGAFVAWQDEVSDNIYIQRLNTNGSPLWTDGGLIICSAAGEQSRVKMVSDGEGGAILVWEDKRNGSSSDLYAQRIRNTGFPAWTANGLPVTTATEDQTSHVIVGNDAGGVFIVWQDYRQGSTNTDIYTQRLSASGRPLWTANGVAISSVDERQASPTIDISSARLFIAWADQRTGVSDIYAQAVDTTNGNPLWTANGIPVCEAAASQMTPRITRDGEGGAIITWADNRVLYDIYAQKLNSSGNALWTTSGIPINEFDGFQMSPEITPDDSGGAFIAWKDYRSEVSYGMYFQHVKTDGSLLLDEDGIPIVASDVEGSHNHIVLSDESGGTFVLWQDNSGDVYAQHKNDNIIIIEPVEGIMLRGDQSQLIRWNLRTPQTRFDRLTIRLSTSPGDGFPHVIARDVDPTQYTLNWTPDSYSSTTATLKIQAINDAGVVLCTSIGHTFSVDSDPPTAFDLVSPADGTTASLTPTFYWESSTDNLSGFDHYELWIDGALLQDNLQTTSYTITEGQRLTRGEHSWTVKAFDQAGLERQALHTWTFTASEDDVPPAAFHLISPDHNTWTTATNPVFSWEASYDDGKGLWKYQVFIDDQLALDDIPPTSTSTSDVILTPGQHTWYMVAVDSAQNTTTSEETWTIGMDNVPPQVFSLSQPQNDAWITDVTPTFIWESSTDAHIGLQKYQLWIDDNLVMDNLPNTVSTVTLPGDLALNEGAHTWSIVAYDNLNNSRVSENPFAVGIDYTPPNSFALISPEDGNVVADASPLFEWQSATDNISGIQEYELWIDGTLSVDGLTSTQSSPAQPLSDGSHTWNIRALDRAGNTTSTPTFNLSVDTAPPTSFHLVSPEDAATLHTGRPTFTWQSSADVTSGLDRYQLYINGQLHTDNIAAGETSTTLSVPLANGIYDWNVRALDMAGNGRFSEELLNFTIDCRAPQITSPGTATATEDIPFTYTATATDPDQDAITISFSEYPKWLSPSGNQISGTPLEATQDTSFIVEVTDGMYVESLKVTLTIQHVNDPPVITSSDAVNATEDVPFLYTATASDPENDNVTFSFQDFPDWLSPSENQMGGTAVEGTQNTSFIVIASDGDLTSTMEVSVTIIPVNDPPQITSPATAIANEGNRFVYRATAVDVDGPWLSIRYIDYPSWLSPSGSEISGTPYNVNPDTTFTVIATDNELSDTLKVAVSVITVNDAPYFEYAFPQPAFYDLETLNWALDLDDYASDPDHPDEELSWSYSLLDPHPLIITIDEETHIATISGSNILGILRIAFTVTDPLNASASDILTISMLSDVDDDIAVFVPDDFVLFDNYPNPFNPTTTIQYGLPHPCHITLGIYNMLGQQIADLVDEKQAAGMYSVVWDASNVNSGVYFFRIQAGTWQKVKRMILMK